MISNLLYLAVPVKFTCLPHIFLRLVVFFNLI